MLSVLPCLVLALLILQFVPFRAFDVAFFIPVAIILNEDIACFGINVFIAVFTLICFWVNFAVQDGAQGLPGRDGRDGAAGRDGRDGTRRKRRLERQS